MVHEDFLNDCLTGVNATCKGQTCDTQPIRSTKQMEDKPESSGLQTQLPNFVPWACNKSLVLQLKHLPSDTTSTVTVLLCAPEITTRGTDMTRKTTATEDSCIVVCISCLKH
ncbi:hypothetical protein DPMN_075866 [Dreissena polymorpha]|uniref:Uncharacterized protein n=1 Tax=Dreissena polymorpha TaxID=45954 RepID=A0A9D3YKF2_DREPO|nr:hypothetical protein DPMN_075866 [Dreissena polymorpha]